MTVISIPDSFGKPIVGRLTEKAFDPPPGMVAKRRVNRKDGKGFRYR